jgi:hypothetical protein
MVGAAASRVSTFRFEPLPNSTSAEPDGKNRAISGAFSRRIANSQRVG